MHRYGTGRVKRVVVCVWLHWPGGAIEAMQPPHMPVASNVLLSGGTGEVSYVIPAAVWHVKAVKSQKLEVTHPSFHNAATAVHNGPAAKGLPPPHCVLESAVSSGGRETNWMDSSVLAVVFVRCALRNHVSCHTCSLSTPYGVGSG